jgi:malate permease and related proteins
MEALKPLSPVVPVFFLIAAGFIFARWKKISLTSVTEIIVYLGTPSLVFSSLASKPLFAGDIIVLSAGVVLIFAGVGLLIRLYFLLTGLRSRGFALPTLFMNAGNMGIPLALFAFGQEGLQRATLMFVIITFLQYSLGIYILNGRGNWTEIFRLPLIYAAIAGLFVNLAQIKIPELLLQPVVMLGQATIPIMLISLGYRLYQVESLAAGPRAGRRVVAHLWRLCWRPASP